MKYLVYAVYDKALDEYSMPFYQKNDACAMRSFALITNCQIRKSKASRDSDFVLYCLGSFDTYFGVLKVEANSSSYKRKVCSFVFVKKAKECF